MPVIMDVIGLPGRHTQTEHWLRAVLDAVASPQARLLRYRHWDEAVDTSIDAEAVQLQGAAPRLVVAKSFGTTVATAAHAARHFRPASAVLIGTPLVALDGAEVDRLRRFAQDVPTLFIQQHEDPGGSDAMLSAALAPVQAAVVGVPGDDHLYGDIARLAAEVRRWMRRPTP